MKLTRVNSSAGQGAEPVAVLRRLLRREFVQSTSELTRVNFDCACLGGDSCHRTERLVLSRDRFNVATRIGHLPPSPRSTVEIAETLGQSGGFCYLGALFPRCTDLRNERSKPASASH